MIGREVWIASVYGVQSATVVSHHFDDDEREFYIVHPLGAKDSLAVDASDIHCTRESVARTCKERVEYWEGQRRLFE